MIQKVELPNGKQLLFVGTRSFQRFPGPNWEPFDQRILVHTPIPKDAKVEVWKEK